MLKVETRQEIEDLARGATLLGTGGGGDPHVGGLFLKNQLKTGAAVRIVPLAEVPDDAFVVSIAGGGSPAVMVEHLESRTTLERLMARAERFHGKTIDYIISGEIGGANATLPLAAGAISGKPVIDGDGVGRAVPKLDMCTFSIYGARVTPSVALDDLGNCIMVEAVDDATAEKIARPTINVLGGQRIGAIFPMSGATTKRTAVPATLTQALELGRLIREARTTSDDVAQTLIDYLNRDKARIARLLFDGKVTDVTHETRDGWHFGKATLQGFDGATDVFTIDIQNEFLAARRNGRLVCTMPDMILVVDRETGEPLTGESLTFGQRVKVIGYSAHPMLRTPEAIAKVGPRCFGLDEDFIPIEDL